MGVGGAWTVLTSQTLTFNKMCAVIGWSGNLPKKLLANLLVNAEVRGKDSTGLCARLARHGKPANVCYRQAVPASDFARLNKKFLKEARRAPCGIAHTRRASPRMPVNSQNAHPFIWPPAGAANRVIFAHNGVIDNWRELKHDLSLKYERELDHLLDKLFGRHDTNIKLRALACAERDLKLEWGLSADDAKNLALAAAKLNYAKNITTDSMVLGPYLEQLNFSSVVGCMALVWLKANRVFVYHCGKELTAANLVWYDKRRRANLVTVACSTPSIFLNSVKRLKVKFDYGFLNLDEGVAYELTPKGLERVKVKIPPPIKREDKFTSAELPLKPKNPSLSYAQVLELRQAN